MMKSCAGSQVWRHKKTGGLYRIVCECLLEADAETEMVVYESLSAGRTWTRPKRDFYDGRFEQLSRRQIDQAKTEQ